MRRFIILLLIILALVFIFKLTVNATIANASPQGLFVNTINLIEKMEKATTFSAKKEFFDLAMIELKTLKRKHPSSEVTYEVISGKVSLSNYSYKTFESLGERLINLAQFENSPLFLWQKNIRELHLDDDEYTSALEKSAGFFQRIGDDENLGIVANELVNIYKNRTEPEFQRLRSRIILYSPTHFDTKNFDDALNQYIDQMVENDSGDNIKEFSFLARAMFQKGRLNDAKSFLEKSLSALDSQRLEADYSINVYDYVKIARVAKDIDKDIFLKVVNNGLKEFYSIPKSSYEMGLNFDGEMAIELLDLTATLGSRRENISNEIERIMGILHDTKNVSDAPYVLVDAVELLVKIGRTDRAKGLIKDLHSKNYLRTYDYLNLGQASAIVGDDLGARNYFNDYIQYSKDRLSYKSLARSQALAGRYEDSMDSISKIKEQKEKDQALYSLTKNTAENERYVSSFNAAKKIEGPYLRRAWMDIAVNMYKENRQPTLENIETLYDLYLKLHVKMIESVN